MCLDLALPFSRFERSRICARPTFHIMLYAPTRFLVTTHDINIQRSSSFPSNPSFISPPNNVPLPLCSSRRLSSRYCRRIPTDLPKTADPKRFAQACAGISTGTGCRAPGEKKSCNEDLINVIFCNSQGQIEFEHCTDGRICAPDGEGSIACFVNGKQPVP